MDTELYDFTKDLKPSHIHKALALKEKMEELGSPPKHFRVSLKSLWAKNFKHDQIKNYTFVKEKLEDLAVAEKNLNRNIDSKAQLEIFLETAKEVKGEFTKRYTAKEWTPEAKPEDPSVPGSAEMNSIPKIGS